MSVVHSRREWFRTGAAASAYGDGEFVTSSRDRKNKVRRYLSGELAKLKIGRASAHGNFVWIDVRERNRDLGTKMAGKAILVRNASSPDENFMKVTIGTEPEMIRFIEAVKDLIRK